MVDNFGPEVVTAVMAHMNGDHAGDNLLIVQELGGLPGAASAVMSGMDADGIDFVADVDGVEHEVRLAWTERLLERHEVREQVVAMHARASQRRAVGGSVRGPELTATGLLQSLS